MNMKPCARPPLRAVSDWSRQIGKSGYRYTCYAQSG